MEPASTAASSSDAPRRQVYVRANGKALRTTVAALEEFFSSCGKPTVQNKWGEEPVGGNVHEVALVTFKKNKAVDKAIARSGDTLDGRQLVIGLNTKPPRPRTTEASASCRVFVGNLPFGVTEAEVRAIFEGVGTILFVRWATESDGSSKGFCHVIFASGGAEHGSAEEVVRAAIARDNMVTLHGRKVRVGAAVQNEKPKKSPSAGSGGGKGASGGSGGKRKKREAAGGEKDPLRPSEWRHDRAAGLTAPRPKQHRTQS